jgi:cyclophilin family peptidyl-prolyl cis-trans isomerase
MRRTHFVVLPQKIKRDTGDSKHPVFGKVTSGMDVVIKISKVSLFADYDRGRYRRIPFIFSDFLLCAGQDRERVPCTTHHDGVDHHLWSLNKLPALASHASR